MGRKKRNFREVTYSEIRTNNNVIELSISKDDDPSLFEEQLKFLLEENLEGKSNLILGILIGINEVVDNILEHSEGGEFKEYDRMVTEAGIVSAQYCNKYDHLVVTIWDFGKGIADTLAEAYNELSKEEAIRKAFEFNITRHKKIFPSRGNGLAKLKEFILKSNGSIFCQIDGLEITFNSSYPTGYITKPIDDIKGTHFTIKINCSKEINIYPIFEIDTFEEFFGFEEEATLIKVKEFIPLNSHQRGIKIKNLITEKIKESNRFIQLDFHEVEIFTDSFIQQITTRLSEEIGFVVFRQRIRFANLSKPLLKMVQEKIYIASNS